MAEQNVDEQAREWLYNNELSYRIWDRKYRHENETLDEWLDRVSNGYKPVRELIKDKKFIFGGRILANRGIKDKKLTYSNCFTGDTRIMTNMGLKSLIECIKCTEPLLVLSRGSWRKAEFRSFGKQPIKELTLRRGGTTRTFKVTGNHLWFIKNSTSLKTTDELSIGDIIPTEVMKCYRTYKPNPVGVAHGFFMGDGDHNDKSGLRVNVCKGKEDLIPYYMPDTIGHFNDVITISSMPKFFLKYPPINESKSYLYGWLAGYFAADGLVDLRGNCVICSTKRKDLEYVQDVLCVLGIPCEKIRSQTRISNLTNKEGVVYILSLNKKYLNENFFIRKTHKDRFINNPFRRDQEWRVENLIDLNHEEEVFCAVVPDTECFTLEGGIKTHNCYVITPPEDNLESIFECASKLARTYSYGGGCGINISKLAPKGATIHNAASSTSGAVSFMELFSQVTGLIGQEERRGALMISLDCHHPDLIDFINVKSDLNAVTKANISVMITDDFMEAVEQDKNWTMSYYRPESSETIVKTEKARDIFRLLAKRNWEMAEPGVLYWDTINNYNLLHNTGFRYAGVNPCSEEPLPAGGACLLGSINLSEFVKHPFTKNSCVDYDELERVTGIAVVGLNQVLEEGHMLHPLKEQRDAVALLRQIGLGTFGMSDMLIKLGITYGSQRSLEVLEEVYKTIAKTAVLASNIIAEKKGCFPMCEKDKIVESSFMKALELPWNTLANIKEHGLYNSQLLTCAPTGSIGTMFDVSTGVEPVFALKYTRKTQSLDGKDTFYEVSPRIVEEYRRITGNTELPEYFIESKDIAPIDRIKVQSVLQKYVDASISSTINLPNEATVEDIYNIYLEAWRHKLKGITVYRQGCQREGILTVDKPYDITVTSAPKRPKDLKAVCYSVKAKGSQYLVMVGLLNDKPYEVFAFKPNNSVDIPQHEGVITKYRKGHYSFKSEHLNIGNLVKEMEPEEQAVTLYCSMLLRHGVSIKYVIKTTKKVNNLVTSFSSAICRILSKYIPVETEGKCPECGGNLIHEGGCIRCDSCEFSKCE